MKHKWYFFMILLLLAQTVSACAPTVEDFVVDGGAHFNGLVETTTYFTEITQRIKLEATIYQGFPYTQFNFFSQEEAVGEGGALTLMTCSPPKLDSDGSARVSCVLTMDKAYRQNAIILAFGEDPYAPDLSIRAEYRPNLITSANERGLDYDYQIAQSGITPNSINNALFIYNHYGLEMEVNAQYTTLAPDNEEYFKEHYAPSRGYYLTFETDTSCSDPFVNNYVSLYKWDPTRNEWYQAEFVLLEDVDFGTHSGEHDFRIGGSIVRLIYSHDTECNGQRYWVEVPYSEEPILSVQSAQPTVITTEEALPTQYTDELWSAPINGKAYIDCRSGFFSTTRYVLHEAKSVKIDCTDGQLTFNNEADFVQLQVVGAVHDIDHYLVILSYNASNMDDTAVILRESFSDGYFPTGEWTNETAIIADNGNVIFGIIETPLGKVTVFAAP